MTHNAWEYHDRWDTNQDNVYDLIHTCATTDALDIIDAQLAQAPEQIRRLHD